MSTERTDLITTLDKHRGFLRQTVAGLDDQQAARTTTVSTLCVGGLIKHVAAVEHTWRRFVEVGPQAFAEAGRTSSYEEGFRMLPGETLGGLLKEYEAVAADTNRLIESLPSLDGDHPLPGARWSARRVFMHILAETAQHAGHADIIRESLDGARTMG